MKFSIRDLMLVTVIVALVLGWWVDRSRLSRMYDGERSLRLEAEIKTAVHQEVNQILENQLKDEVSTLKARSSDQFRPRIRHPRQAAPHPTIEKNLTAAGHLWHATSPALCSNLHFPTPRISP